MKIIGIASEYMNTNTRPWRADKSKSESSGSKINTPGPPPPIARNFCTDKGRALTPGHSHFSALDSLAFRAQANLFLCFAVLRSIRGHLMPSPLLRFLSPAISIRTKQATHKMPWNSIHRAAIKRKNPTVLHKEKHVPKWRLLEFFSKKYLEKIAESRDFWINQFHTLWPCLLYENLGISIVN